MFILELISYVGCRCDKLVFFFRICVSRLQVSLFPPHKYLFHFPSCTLTAINLYGNNRCLISATISFSHVSKYLLLIVFSTDQAEHLQ
jgi:hypothetical protein